ncbi:arsenate reductase (glutaredoxin) [Flavobacteriaceae bacterium]|nr:arsenate reductase (glutaredoxin) [Flavobacteriaceae bacterium]
MKYTIYHNPRCRKSREALQLLEEKNIKFKIINYLKEVFDKQSLEKVLDVIGKKPSEALRKNEEIWRKQFSGKKIGEEEILKLMIKYPKLIERPMVINGNKGVIARPLENLMDFIDNH